MSDRMLADKRILVVEDEFFLADDLCRDLEGVGATVVGPAPSVKRALALLEANLSLDAVLLDVNLGGELSYPVADALLANSVPFVFTSGYDEAALGKHYSHVPRCQKPADLQTIVRALAAVMRS